MLPRPFETGKGTNGSSEGRGWAGRRFRRFVREFSALVESHADGEDLIARGAALVGHLVSTDDWLPESCAEAPETGYRQYLLHCDGMERFSVVSFVWSAGAATPIHDHGVWGIVGILRGSEVNQVFEHGAGGCLVPTSQAQLLQPGAVVSFAPGVGEVHRVANGLMSPSISIHVYGGNIGAIARRSFEPDGTVHPFISGYSNSELPNIWSGPITNDAD